MKTWISRALVALATLVVLAPAAADAGTWEIDTVHSSVSFKVRHFFSKTAGSFNQYSGVIEFDPDKPAKSSVDVTIQSASVDTNNDDRDAHLRGPDFFNAEEFPTLTFKSKSVKTTDHGMEMTGDLTMRGVTKEVTIPFEFLGAGPDAWGGTRAGFTGSVTINRKDFGIEWNKALDAGGFVLGDDVSISLEIEASKKSQS